MNRTKTDRVRTGVLLAAGRGLRLNPLTKEKPKCLTRVNEKPILEWLMDCLKRFRFEKLIVVTGHKADCIKQFLGSSFWGVDIDYIYNNQYRTTNNIYSLYLAGKRISSPFLLIESDIIFYPDLLKQMIYPDRIALADPAPWMNGTCVAMDGQKKAVSFQEQIPDMPESSLKKTVNIYSFSLQSWQRVKVKLEQEILRGNTQAYYETVFKKLVQKGQLDLTGVMFEPGAWYEIDTLEDLAAAEALFGRNKGHNAKHRTFAKTVFPFMEQK